MIHNLKEDSRETFQYLIPTWFLGIGGFPKAVFPRLDALITNYFGYRPDPLSLSIFDFDEANAEINIDGERYSTHPYLIVLPKKPLKDASEKLKDGKKIPWIQNLQKYVRFDSVHYAESPGLNLFPQSGNLAWRLCWTSHVLPEITRRLKALHPAPKQISDLENKGLKVSNRSVIWVVAGGGSTTGPTGLLPILCEIKRNKPPESNLFPLIFTPEAYRDKSEAQQTRGRAIFSATMECMCGLFNGKVFEQPYDPRGNYKIFLQEDPCDLPFLIDGTIVGGRTELEMDDLGNIVANFLFRFSTGAIGEQILRIIGNFTSGLKGINEKEGKNGL